MRIKVFKADDIKTAMDQVKEELGNDAVILHTKRYKKSTLLGLKSKEIVEVTAAVEDDATAPPRPRQATRQKSGGRKTNASRPIPRLDVQSAPPPISVLNSYKTAGTEEGVAQSERRVAQLNAEPEEIDAAQYAPPAPQVQTAPPPVPPAPAPAAPPRREKAATPKQTTRRVIKNPAISEAPAKQTVAEPPAPAAPAPLAAPAASSEDKTRISALESEIQELKRMLKEAVGQPTASGLCLRDVLNDQDIELEIIEDMIRRMPSGSLKLPKDSPEALDALSRYFKLVLRDPGGITLKDNRSRLVALVGTTGVGKTTTLAKIAAKFVLERGADVALITADTYRISAVDQLKTYSDIIGLPLEIVYSPNELKSAIRKFKAKELVLIDTAGRSQRNDYQMQELVDLLAAEPAIEKHLVLSATTKERDAADILERFAPVKPDRLLFTKTDETQSFGLIVNLLYKRRMSVSYLTNGQNVPDDIEAATAETIAAQILKIRN